MLRQLLSLRLRRPVLIDEEDTPRYPPFMRGLPASSVDKLLTSQDELIGRLRQAVGVSDRLFNGVYQPLIRRYAAYVHLLPASEAHHHRGAGGLLRHGLEVALWAVQGADRVMFAMGETPARRRELEPRWRCGVFLAALAHDLGKPLSDVRIIDESGRHEWGGQGEDLAEWLGRIGARRYFLQWRTRRHQRHESLTPLVLPHIIPRATLDYLQTAGPELYEQILFSISSRDFQARDQEHNLIFKLVREADQHSTRKDIGDPVAAGLPGALGVPLERYLMDAMRRLVRERRWLCNQPGARLWVIADSLFVVWPAGADDIVRALARDKAPGIPRHPDSLADVLLDRGLAVAFEETGQRARMWPIQPAPLRERNPGVVLHALRLDANAGVFDERPASVEGRLGIDLLDDVSPAATESRTDAQEAPTSEQDNVSHPYAGAGDLEEPNPAEAETAGAASGSGERHNDEQSPTNELGSLQRVAHMPSTRESESGIDRPSPTNRRRRPGSTGPAQTSDWAPEPGHSPPTGSNANEATRSSTAARRPEAPTKAPSEVAAGSQSARQSPAEQARDAADARDWFARRGHAGAIIGALAEDFADGAKRWGEHGVYMRDGAVAIRHPEGWAGAGVAGKEILPLLVEAGWVAIDPFQPMKKVREVEGFTGLKGASRQSALVLIDEVSARVIEIAGATAAPSATAARTRPTGPAPTKARTFPATSASKGRAPRAASSRPARVEPLTSDAVLAALHDLIEADVPSLAHRRDGERLRIPYAEAVTAIALRLGLSRSKAMQALSGLRAGEGEREIVIPARRARRARPPTDG
ncbi:MAG: TraI domain-containing protein [Nitrococcus mobilis]|nr:TraI domain-containing protein [Nitrococcus mobilis]